MPVAIIGMSCKLPGDATSPLKLWRLCAEGRSAWSEIPPDRFKKEAFYHASSEKRATTNVIGGHFLTEDLGVFDATFFNMTPEVASTMDPQCRLLLESVFEALESAGIPLDKAAGSETAVFAGAFFRDYMDSLMRDPDTFAPHLMTGNGSAMMSNRISHFYDLRGPSMTVDTGCSTGLVALHQACQSLRSSDAKMAIVGGANVMINPDNFIVMSSLGILGAEGKSYAFDSRAGGYGRGEGVGTIILKPLRDAIRDGDPIRAVIRESALNQDGKTQTITSPSQAAQEELIRVCYERAGLNPTETPYVEAHGTGTLTGDPIEAGAIHSVMGKGRRPDQPLYIGSVKTNVGHVETASGFASIIKVAFALEKGLIPPSINFEHGNKKILFDEWNMKVPRQLEPWPTWAPRRASINNFGYGGTNAHVILEAWTPPQDNPVSILPGGLEDGRAVSSRVLLLSAKEESVVRSMAQNLRDWAQDKDANDKSILDRLVHTLGERRTKFNWRLALAVQGLGDLQESLEASKLAPTRSTGAPRLGFVFTGQGAQWYAMGRELIGVYPVFTDTLREADQCLKNLGSSWSVMEELTKDEKESRISDVVISPPACLVLQVALFRLLESWGISAVAMTSHSSGEVAAAVAAGVHTLQEGLCILYARGGLLDSLNRNVRNRGAMMAVGLGREETESYLEQVSPSSGKAVVACVNSPTSVTVSGDQASIDELEEMLVPKGVFARKLKVLAAYHSHHMSPVAEDYIKALRAVLKRKPVMDDVRYTSPVTGGQITDGAQIGPEHWVRSMLQPVEFADALRHMCFSFSADGGAKPKETHVDMLVEIGPHSALAGPIRQCFQPSELKGANITYGSCLVRGKDAVDTMHTLVASLVAKGYPVNLDAVNFPRASKKLSLLPDLPSYPWNHRTRHWWESRVNKAHRQRVFPSSEVLGTQLLASNGFNPTWRNIISPSEVPWVREHTVQSNIVYPGAGLISMAVEAMRQQTEINRQVAVAFRLQDVDIKTALVIPDTSEGVEVQLSLRKDNSKTLGLDDWWEFSICSTSDESTWQEHCKGFISPFVGEDKIDHLENMEVPDTNAFLAGPDSSTHTAQVNPDDIFTFFRSVGIYHGPVFRNIKEITHSPGRSVAKFSVADIAVAHEAVLHPTTLDSVFQATYSALNGGGSSQGSAMVPRSIKSMFISAGISRAAGDPLLTYSRLQQSDKQGFHASISVQNGHEGGDTNVLEIEDLFCQSLGEAVSQSEDESKCLTVEWQEDLTLTSLHGLTERLKMAPDVAEIAVVADMKRACFYFFSDAVLLLAESDVESLLWYHKIFYEWMKLQIAQEPRALEWLDASRETRQELFEVVSRSSVDGEMVCRIGRNLVPILRQQTAPLELMLEGQLLYRYYREALRFPRSYAQVNQLVKLLSHKNPRLKVLEIGAGTGGCTKTVLEALGGGDTGRELRLSSYDFTDISSGFFEEARSRFDAWRDVIQYRKLDVEVDAADQGFEKQSYDLIVACQVLHATKNMDHTMSNVRSLLKPGGKLIMVETTHDMHDIQLIFGVVPGWWLSEEPERKHSPSLTVDLWDTVLRRTGFSGLDMQVKDCEDEENYMFSVMCSTAAAAPAAAEDGPVERLHEDVLVTYAQPPSQAWSQQLIQAIETATGSAPGFASIESASLDPDGKVCIFIDSADVSVLASPSEVVFGALKRLATRAKGLLWVSHGGSMDCANPFSALSAGFLRTLRVEDTTKRYVSLDLEADVSEWSTGAVDAVVGVFTTAFDSARDDADGIVESEYAARGTSILIPRIWESRKETEALAHGESQPIELGTFVQPDRELRLDVLAPGMLDTLTFCDDTDAETELAEDFVEIEPKAFGLNFRDVMVAMGQLQSKVMGFECSGIVTRTGSKVPTSTIAVGDRICGLLRGHWANHPRVHWTSVAKIPDGMSFEDAATIPMAYVTAYHSLHNLANLGKGEKVLIHSAAGGVGQAAVMLAKLAGAEIFATAGSAAKRAFISEQYGIPEDHVFSSRDGSFARKIRQSTGGKGVDVVLNSLAGQLLHETWSCIAPFGRFVEIGKRDFEQNNNLQMSPFTRATSFFAVDLIMLGNLKQDVVGKTMSTIMDLFSRGSVGTVSPITTYPISDIEKAFRTMQSGKHLGKLVIVPHAQDLVKMQRRRPRLSAEASYLVVGGATGLGKAVSRRLVDLGAKHIILMSRNASAAKNAPFVNELSSGAKVLAVDVDVADAKALSAAIQTAREAGMPPIRGVVQGAMVLQDSIFENMTHDDYMVAVRPKVVGTWNLHEQFSEADSLDWFIMLSSLCGIVGNSSQANYAAGGSFQDALAKHRTSKGLATVSLDLGMVGEVGYVAERDDVAARLNRQGWKFISQEDILALVESSISSSSNSNSQKGNDQVLIGLPTDLDPGTRKDLGPWALDARFSTLFSSRNINAEGGSGSGSKRDGNRASPADLANRLRAAGSFGEAVEVTVEAIVAKLAQMFARPDEEVDRALPIAQQGVDSLVAVELRNWLSVAASGGGEQISIFDIMQSKSLSALAELACARSRLVKVAKGKDSDGNMEGQ
ncbi:reducing type I polyketide synthase [Diplogelasinospora grovesii]|uniref:Reducing type I polyketide synthase n=1 Tax=Diplogelasinospora grovesii TaxID=303347 RepID=A0AAN6NLI8_9PEZI|nr:reducing type I polyketide synthase [Diplogelasinospora grovesii]